MAHADFLSPPPLSYEHMFVQLLPQEMVDKIRNWDSLKRWERREIGQMLRRMGLGYTEIRALIPVAKGTLSGWCRDIEFTPEQRARLFGPRGRRQETGALLRRRAVDRANVIRAAAREEAASLGGDPFWVAGSVAYWAEGDKRSKEVKFSNSDPGMIKLFIAWARRFLDVDLDRLTIMLHLHSGQDEEERIAYWSEQTGFARHQFRKSFIKPEGTGHRKNVLYNGTAQIRVRRSTDLMHRVRGWLDALPTILSPAATMLRGASSTGRAGDS